MAKVSFKRQLRIVIILAALVSLVELVNIISGRSLTAFGIFPRSDVGLRGIVFAPFIHGSLVHFTANIVPLVVFVFFTLQYGLQRFYWVTFSIILGSGVLVWLFGRSAMHIGASGLIYGYFAFLLVAGFLSGRFRLMLVSILVAVLYGGLIFGVMPTAGYVSWESHLFGFVVGLAAAKRWAKY